MGGLLAKLLVALELQDGVSGELDKPRKSVKDFAKDMGAMGTKFTATVTTPIVAGFALMVNSASDLAESTSAVEATYEDAAGTIIDASEDSANAVGMSQQEYLDAAKSLGVYAKAAGLSGEAMTDFGMDTIGAAADLASFHNADPTEVLDAIKAGLTGETEPLKRFGIMMNEASVQAKAMEMGLVGANGEISEENKILARQQIIMEQLGPAQGDFAKTSEGLANQQRIMKARLKDVSAQFGKFLLPYMLKATKIASKLLTWVEGLSDRNKKLALAMAGLAAAIGPVLIALSMMLPALALLVSPIGLIVIALAALGMAYATNLFGFRDAVNAVAKVVWEILKPIAAFGKALYDAFTSGKPVADLVEQFPGILQPVIKPFLLIADAIGDLVAAFRSGGLEGLLNELPGKILQIAKAFFDLHKAVLDLFLQGLEAAWPYVKEFLENIPGWIGDAVGKLYSVLRPKANDLLNGFKERLNQKWSETRTWLNGRKEAIRTAFGEAVTFLAQKGTQLIAGFFTAVRDKWADVRDWLNGRKEAIKQSLGETIGTLRERGEDLIDGFFGGAKALFGVAGDGKDTLVGWITKIPGYILNHLTNALDGVIGDIRGAGNDLLSAFFNGLKLIWGGTGGEEGGMEGWIRGLPWKLTSAIAGAVSAAYQSLKNAGAALIQAFWDGALEIWNRIPGPIRDLIGKAGIQGMNTSPSLTGMGASGLYASGSAAMSSVSAPITININGYNRDPNELASAISRELRLAGTALWP